MGMIETRLKRVPEGKTLSETMSSLRKDLSDYFSDYENSCEDYTVKLVEPENFDQIWEVQETFKNTPEIKEKYRNLAKNKQLIAIEIDY
jgi:hypothetical protein